MPEVRIALVHALRESIEPIAQAFAAGWPEASIFSVLDDSLSDTLALAGGLTGEIVGRFIELGRYAARARCGALSTDGILFTCSAFGPAIEAVQRDLSIPVHKPTEAAFTEALGRGGRIGLLVTYEPSLPALLHELDSLARCRSLAPDLRGAVVPGALAALQAGDRNGHDARIAAAAAAWPDCDVILLGQFSMARARAAMPAGLRGRVLTTPDGAVLGLRRALARKDPPT